MIKKRLASMLLALAVVFGVVVVSPTPAMASWSQCQSGFMCFWAGQNATGAFYGVDYDVVYSEWGWTLPTMNNASDSWWNRTGRTIQVFDSPDCAYSGWYKNLGGSQTTSQGSDWGSKISSVAYSGRINYPC